MSGYTGQTPDTERTPDWRDNAACRAPQHRDAMHPENSEAGIANAKKICRTCTVQLACLRDAILTGDDQYGIRAALKAGERRAVAARLDGHGLTDEALAGAVQRLLNPSTARTLRDIWDDRSHTLPDGHMGWRGKPRTPISFQGQVMTPKQVAFQVDRGRPPVGCVRRMCGVEACVHPRHVTDNVERHQLKAAERAEEAGLAVSV